VSFKEKRLYLLAFALAMVAFIAFVAGRGCAPTPTPDPSPQGIDAGPGEIQIASDLDASIQQGNEQLAAIEHKFEGDIAAFDEAQQAEYDRIRDGGLEATTQYLLDWNRRRMRLGEQ